MLTRIYANNFRCFENFSFKPNPDSSVLLVGKNGSGKSTLRAVLKLLQQIGQGKSRVGDLVKSSDFTRGRSDVPIRIEVDANVRGRNYSYSIAFELPERFRELRVLQESLAVDGHSIFNREVAQVTHHRDSGSPSSTKFNMDWHLVALPVIQDHTLPNALEDFRQWLASIVILAPIPVLMKGEADTESTDIDEHASNWANWLSDILERYPSAYSDISEQLRHVMPDLADFRFERIGKDAKALVVRFKNELDSFELPAESLSDGEKCFFLCAVVLAANRTVGPLLTFWDEPDNYLSLHEVSQFVTALRAGFTATGQIMMTSHNAEAIRRFSNDSTWILGRRSHAEPTLIARFDEFPSGRNLLNELTEGELEPWQSTSTQTMS